MFEDGWMALLRLHPRHLQGISLPCRSLMFEQAFKNIDDVLWKDAGCTSELDYTEQSSWLSVP